MSLLLFSKRSRLHCCVMGCPLCLFKTQTKPLSELLSGGMRPTEAHRHTAHRKSAPTRRYYYLYCVALCAPTQSPAALSLRAPRACARACSDRPVLM